MASYSPDEGRSSSEGGDSSPRLPFRSGGADRTAHTEARAELRDRETYYTELRLAVRGQSRSVPEPRAALDDQDPDSKPTADAKPSPHGDAKGRADGEPSADGESGTNEKPGAKGEFRFDGGFNADEKYSVDGKRSADEGQC